MNWLKLLRVWSSCVIWSKLCLNTDVCLAIFMVRVIYFMNYRHSRPIYEPFLFSQDLHNLFILKIHFGIMTSASRPSSDLFLCSFPTKAPFNLIFPFTPGCSQDVFLGCFFFTHFITRPWMMTTFLFIKYQQEISDKLYYFCMPLCIIFKYTL